MNELNKLEDILSSFLGESKNGMSDSSQIQYCCPQCSEDDNVESDGKFNLEINILKGRYRCWKCEVENGMHGRLSNLIKKYGGDSLLYDFRKEVDAIKKSKEYEFNLIENNIVFEEDEDLIIKLPDKTYNFVFDGNKRESLAIKYLESRGINEFLIKKFNLQFTDNYCPNKNFKNRIIIPSYNKYGVLNYFTARDYTNKSFRKYYNFENSNRKEIIFNEHLLNWDADVILVEGPTDHIVVPNSVPLLGKSINSDYYLFECIIKKSTQNIIVFLDDDATEDAIEICRKLSSVELCGRLKIVPTKKLLNKINNENSLCLKKIDPSKLYELYKQKGISFALKMAEEYICV